MTNENETIDDIIKDILENDGYCISPTSLFAFDEDGGIMLGDLAERIKVAHERELAAKDAEIAELRECLRLSSNSMEMVVQWLGKYPAWQECLKNGVARNRKVLEGDKK